MSNEATIPGSAVLELKNVPTELLLYAVQQWTPCHKYATGKGTGKNTNTFIKAIAVWLILKNETPSGKLQNYRQQLPQLAAKNKMCVRSLDKYISWLRQEDLLQVVGSSLMVSPMTTLKQYGINTQNRQQTILYDTTGKANLPEIIIAIGIELMKEKPMQAYWKKVTKNPDALTELSNHLIAYGADKDRLDDPEYFRMCHERLLVKTYKEADAGQSSFYLLHKYIDANPDLSFKASTYARKMGLSVLEKQHPVTKKDESVSMGFSHIKTRLSKKGLLQITKVRVTSEYRARKDEKIFHHRWLKKTAQTIWFRPDKIAVNVMAIYKQKLVA